MFYPRPDSPLHLPNEEPVLGYLKFSAKGTKREVFGMPIPGSLITAYIQEASYYQEYLENVAKHRRYMSGETGSDQDSPAPKPTKPARKPKTTAPKAPPRPTVVAEDTDLQKALEESMKTAYAAAPQGLLPPVFIREPESGKYQPLPEVPRKDKAKAGLDLGAQAEGQTGSDAGGQDEGQARSNPDENSKGQAGPDPGNAGDDAGLDLGAQAEGQTGSDAGGQDEGQARSNPDENSKGQAGPDPGNAGDDVHSISSPVVHVGSDREHMDLDVADVSPQPITEQLDEGFTATAYLKVQENLKLTVEEQVLLEEPASSSETLSSLQHLSKDISFRDLFFSNKPSEANKNAETKVESMVNVPIQQALSSISLMTSPIIDLTSRPESPKETKSYKSHEDHMQLFEALEKLMNRDHSEELAQDLAEVHLEIDEDIAPNEQAQSPDDEDIGSAHIPKVNLRQDWWKPFKEERPATPEPAWSIRSSNVLVPTNNWASALAGDITTFMDWFCKRRGITDLKPQDLEGPIFEIVKVLHPDVIHLQYQMEECHKLLTDSVDDPILRHNVSKPLPLGGPPGQIKWCPISFGLKRSANTILVHCMVSLSGGSKENNSTLIDTHLKDTYKVQMMMRFNEIHKFSDGTLQQTDKALDYRVKEFRINRMNPGLNTRSWTRKDVDRSKAFMFAIQKRLKTRRIFRNL
nr:histone deacetylase 14 [Tanacetum cinerariifolium]